MTATADFDTTSQYLAGLLAGNRKVCSAIAKAYLDKNNSYIDLYEKVFRPALYEVGKLWEKNRITVADEHMATAITEGILNEYFEEIISSERVSKKAVVACVESELHQVGIKMVADVFEMNGWDSYFLGTGIPVKELIAFIHSMEPDLLALGGQAFSRNQDMLANHFKNVTVITDLYALEKFIRSNNVN